MKINKLMSLDFELVEKLKKEQNASKLVNDLIKQHYSGGQMSKDALRQEIINKKALVAGETHNLKELESQMNELTRPKTMAERIRT